MDAYTKWMRFVHILVQETDINGIDAQITLTRQLKEILDIEKNAYCNPHHAIVSYKNTHRDNRYLDAEAEKADKILSAPEWNEVFAEAENDSFLQGSCMFYYQSDIRIETYKSRTQNVKFIFQKNGITKPFAEYYLLVRGILCRNYDWSSYRGNADNFTITNRDVDRFLRNLTIWNDNAEVKRFFCELLDCSDVEQMKKFVQEVIKEEHTVVYNKKQFDDDKYTTIYLNKVYRRLFKEEEMKPLHWLYDTGMDPLRVHFYNNGNAAIYKGPVNSFFLGIERHRYASEVIKKFKDKFDFQFTDDRQADNFEKYGNYTGDTLTVSSKDGVLPKNSILRVNFFKSEDIEISINNPEYAQHLSKVYEPYYDAKKFKDLSGEDTEDQGYFKVIAIHNADRLDKEEILKIFELAYNSIQTTDV